MQPGASGQGGLSDSTDVRRVRALGDAVRANVGRVVVGKATAVDLLLVALLAEGHALLEDVPGVGKTTLARAMARSLDLSFARIQGTVDLLPGDVTGVSYFDQKASAFSFRPGPIFASIVLADEVNRATPRTQSALLEAMQERQVTVDGETRPLPRPFMLLATQNPIELEGTFPLPEAQLDRFLLRARLSYPSVAEERTLLERYRLVDPLDTLTPVASSADVQAMFHAVRAVRVTEPVADYLLSVVRGTRDHPSVELGASPRAALALYRAAQARAALDGRSYVKPDDVKRLAAPVLAHRLVLSSQNRLRGQAAELVLQTILEQTPVPVEDVPA